MRTTIFVIILTIIMIATGVSYTDTRKPVQRGNRILAIDINEAENKDFAAAFHKAQEIGIQDVGLTFDWNTLEPEIQKYDAKWLSIANIFYPDKKVGVSLTIRPISTNRKVVPPDLMDVSFDDPRMIWRFKNLIDFVFSQITDVKIDSLVIGSEMDVYLGEDSLMWKQYTEFYNLIGSYIRKKHPRVKIAAEGTFDGLTGKSKTQLKTLNRYNDIIGVSYYPLNNDFTVKDPSIVSRDFASISALYPTGEIWFYQLGYPSGELLKSSEVKQSQFISEVFKAWDRNKRIKMVDFTWMHDLPQASLDFNASYYGLSDPAFLEFLRTLGLRSYSGAGTDKLAFKTLKREAMQRGWGVVKNK
ncbi:MAG: hypothetical protein ACYC0V_02580 [Armatimonadota bacterium]